MEFTAGQRDAAHLLVGGKGGEDHRTVQRQRQSGGVQYSPVGVNAHHRVREGNGVKVALFFVFKESVRKPEPGRLSQRQVADGAVRVVVVAEPLIRPAVSKGELRRPGLPSLVQRLHASNQHVHGDGHRFRSFIFFLSFIVPGRANPFVVVGFGKQFVNDSLLRFTN